MPPRCPNCKSKMEYEPPNYVCPGCGLVINRYDFDKVKREHFKTKRTEEDPFFEKKKKNKDYLDWYTSSDKEKFDE